MTWWEVYLWWVGVITASGAAAGLVAALLGIAVIAWRRRVANRRVRGM